MYNDHTPTNASVGNPDYHLSTDMADRAIYWITAQKSITPDRPFMMQWAPGAMHAPHHAPKAYRDKYKGKFDMGWDAAREQILKNQIARGIMPASTKLAPRPDDIPAWDSLTPAAEKVVCPPDGGVRGPDGTCGSRDRPHDRGPRAHGHARQHPDPAHLRQRRQRRRRIGGQPQRGAVPQWRRQDIVRREPEALRRVGQRRDRQSLSRRLGDGGQHPVPLLQADHPQRRHRRPDDRPLAQGHPREGRTAHPVPPHHRHCADLPRRRADATARHRGRREADAARRRQHALFVQRRQSADQSPGAVLRDVRASLDL